MRRTIRNEVIPRAMLAILLLGAAPQTASAQGSEEWIGNWQLNLFCNTSTFSSTGFFNFSRVTPGLGLVATVPQCGTIATPDAVYPLASCLRDPESSPVKLTGDGMIMPATGDYVVTASVPEQPFPFPLVGCSQVGIISSAVRFIGNRTLRDESTGALVAVGGIMVGGPVHIEEASGATCFEIDEAPSCNFQMRRNDARIGRDITVEPRHDTRVTFSQISAAGTVAVTPETRLAGRLPNGVHLIGDVFDSPIALDVTTTAEFFGSVTVCMSYLDRDNDGFLDQVDANGSPAPSIPESALRLLHEENQRFVDRTVRRDAERNVICAKTTKLAQFALVEERDRRRRIPAWRAARTSRHAARGTFGRRGRLATR